MILVKYHQDIAPLELALGLAMIASYYEKRPPPARLPASRALTPSDGPMIEEAAAVFRHACAVFGWKLTSGYVARLMEEDLAPPLSEVRACFISNTS